MTSLPTVQWRKSSYSNGMGGECVEVARLPTDIAVRDSKAPTRPCITVGARAWEGFIGAVRDAKSIDA
ncbi:DUF397 domain-containing protein [Streptomyces sp. NPDC050732]|uniref:DUF397 domain-containing protein n=1 Tax=Streptomyces sp. NPDC050732 TaxID=3154632 RepID=UPI0034286887